MGIFTAGGLIVAGNLAVELLFDEESGRWLTLPNPMAAPCLTTQLASVSASALQAAAAVDAGH